MLCARHLVVIACCGFAAACSADKEAVKRQYVQSGDEFAARGKPQEAVVQYRNAIQHDPQFGDARRKLAETLLALGESSEGLREYLRAADLLPNDMTVQLRAGQLLLVAKQYEDARAKANLVLSKEPTNVNAQILRGNALAGVNEIDAAVKQVEESIRYSPRDSFPLTSLAALELSRGRLEPAEAAFRRAVEVDPSSVFARVALANFLWSTGRKEAAEPVLIEAHRLAPNDVMTNRALAGLLSVTGRATEAEPYLVAVVNSTDDDSTRLLLADYYLGVRRITEAKGILDAIAAHPKSQRYLSDAKVRLAAIRVAAHDNDGALQLLNSAIQNRPDSEDARLAKADLLQSTSRFDEALKVLGELAQMNPDSAAAQFATGRVHAARKDYPKALAAYSEALRLKPGSPRIALELARVNLALGKPAAAVVHARTAVAADAMNIDAQFLLARALTETGDLASAKVPIDALGAAKPLTAEILVERGNYFRLTHDLARARKELERALQLDPRGLDATVGLAALDLESKQPAQARARIDGLLAVMPDDARALTMAGQIYRAAGDAPAAERALRRAIEKDSSQQQAFISLGELYASQHKLDEARAEFERVAAQNPKSVASLTIVAVILQAQGRTTDAKRAYERVLEVDASAAIAANNLAWLYAESNEKLDVALQLAQTAKAGSPNRPDINDTLGWVYYKKRLSDLAIGTFQESADDSPRNPIYQYHLGLAYAQKGDTANAKLSMKKALLISSAFPGADDARRILSDTGSERRPG